MRFSLILLAFAGICLGSTARTEQEKTGNSTQGLDKPKYEGYYTLRVYAPDNKQLHGKVINARDKAFIIGAEKPTTFCDLKDKRQCPDGSRTLINDEMTQLAVSLPLSSLVAMLMRPSPLSLVGSSYTLPPIVVQLHTHLPTLLFDLPAL